jgi:ribose 5-phosphate isomerase A
VLRQRNDSEPFRTDCGNFIVDCGFGPIADAAALECALSCVVGVVETGLFIGMAELALVAGDDGLRMLRRGDPAG